MARVKTFANNGSVLPGDLNSIQDDYEYAFSAYRPTLFERVGISGIAPTAATYVLQVGAGSMASAPLSSNHAFYFDPTDYTANTRTTKLRVRGQLVTNAVATTTTWTIGLYPVSTWGGASGSVTTIATIGAVTAGSTIAFAAPGATAAVQGNSGDFTMPAAGWYVLGVVNNGAAAANSSVGVWATLQLRQT